MRNLAPPRLVLASASPARLRTLQAAGIDAEVIVSGVDESGVAEKRPDALCGTLAEMKARAVADRLRGSTEVDTLSAHDTRGTFVLGCDSVLAFDGEILGKPTDAADAIARWRRMRGRSGVLYTGHCVLEVAATAWSTGRRPDGPAGSRPARADAKAPRQDRLARAVAATTVRFANVSDDEIAAYVATGEPLHVAGAFTIDGLGGPFVEGIEGDPGTVIGLSLPLLRRLLADLGVRIDDLWRPAIPRVNHARRA